MKKIFRWLAILIFAVPVVGLAVANRHWVTFSADPFSQTSPFFSISLPLFLLLLGFMLAGIIIGGMAAWFNQGKWRRAARTARADTAKWQDEALRLREEFAREIAVNAPPRALDLPPQKRLS